MRRSQMLFISGKIKHEVIKKSNYYKNHFRLTEEEQALLETAFITGHKIS